MSRSRCLLIQVVNPQDQEDLVVSNMMELEDLVKTFGGVVVERVIQHRITPHPATYIGPGKLEALVETVKNRRVEIVIANDVVRPSQLFRIERKLWQVSTTIGVWDKVDLILAIFEQHASSLESKLQIELARLDHMGPRIYGLGGGELSRQGGGIGTRGKGETNIEFERRNMRKRRQLIVEKLKKIKGQKSERVIKRSERGLGPVALVGYTSAGKSTLFNALTGKTNLTSTKLFTTLDTTVGKMKAPTGSLPVILSDTIGFIRDLPPKLIEAFESTLLESLSAELVLHLIDLGDPDIYKKVLVVDEILAKLKISKPVILVGNKLDTVRAMEIEKFQQLFKDRERILVSAKTGEGLAELKQLIWRRLQSATKD